MNIKRIKTAAVLLFTFIGSVTALIISLFDWNGYLHGHIMRIWAKLILLLVGVKLDVKGLEHLEKANPAIILINHESAIDIPVILAALPIQERFVAKIELFRVPIFGWALFLGKNVPVDRKNPKKAIKTMNEKIGRLIDSGWNIIISPEGTRSNDGNISPFKRGGFKMAKKFNIPLIPVTMMGNRYCLPNKSLLVNSGKIEVIIDKAHYTSDYESLQDCVDATHKIMAANKKNYESKRRETNIV